MISRGLPRQIQASGVVYAAKRLKSSNKGRRVRPLVCPATNEDARFLRFFPVDRCTRNGGAVARRHIAFTRRHCPLSPPAIRDGVRRVRGAIPAPVLEERKKMLTPIAADSRCAQLDE